MADKIIPIKLRLLQKSLLSKINLTFDKLAYDPIAELIHISRDTKTSMEVRVGIHMELGRYLYDIENNIMQQDSQEML